LLDGKFGLLVPRDRSPRVRQEKISRSGMASAIQSRKEKAAGLERLPLPAR
jgi:hypothetical protein